MFVERVNVHDRHRVDRFVRRIVVGGDKLVRVILQKLDTLRRLGCDFIQGYYFAKPMSGDAIGDYLSKERARLEGAEAKVVA